MANSPAPFPPICAWHTPLLLPYIAAHEDAARRHQCGELQTQCPTCLRWLFPEEWGTPAPSTLSILFGHDGTTGGNDDPNG